MQTRREVKGLLRLHGAQRKLLEATEAMEADAFGNAEAQVAQASFQWRAQQAVPHVGNSAAAPICPRLTPVWT
jgi:hypothetical protein